MSDGTKAAVSPVATLGTLELGRGTMGNKLDIPDECPVCDGTGEANGDPDPAEAKGDCPKCHGSGDDQAPEDEARQ